MKFSPKAVVFDLDGTLIDTSIDIANACNKALISEGLPAFPLNEYRKIVGWGVRHTMFLATPDEYRNDEKLLTRLYKKQLINYKEAPCEKTTVYTGIADLLKFLVEKEFPIAIWTNKDEDIAQTVVKKFFHGITFKIIVGNVKDRPPKPDSSASSLIIKSFSLPKEKILYVGDSDVDMLTATNSCFFPLGVLWGYRTKKELLTSGAKFLAEKPSEILNLFKS